jgi:hypothetical protein
MTYTGKGVAMPSPELLWTIQEERRRQRASAARERRARVVRGRALALGSLVGWLRQRLRVLRAPRGSVVGGTSVG